MYLVYKIALEWDGSLSDRLILIPVNCPWLIAYDAANDYCEKGSFCVRAGTAGDGVTCNVVSRWLGHHTEWPLVCCCLPGWHGARLVSCWPQVGPMLAPWDLLSGWGWHSGPLFATVMYLDHLLTNSIMFTFASDINENIVYMGIERYILSYLSKTLSGHPF